MSAAMNVSNHYIGYCFYVCNIHHAWLLSDEIWAIG